MEFRTGMALWVLIAGFLVTLGEAAPESEDFRVKLPESKRAIPEPLAADRGWTSFKIRGIKGWNWTAEQYLAEIPLLAGARMNFLMNCYLSMYSDPEKLRNEWWRPIPEAKRQAFAQVIRKSKEYGIEFCFAVHPQLHSPRPLDPASSRDLDSYYQHFAWAQSEGVKWFCIPLDDVAGVRIDATEQARFVNLVYQRLRDGDRAAKLIFCPTHYAGVGTDSKDRAYLEALAKELDPSVYVFWTGPGVFSEYVTLKDAEKFRSIVRHRVILWDNYPVNDAHPTLHLGPVRGRDPQLPRALEGYMSNAMCPQNQINRIPMLTCADYAYNPMSYDPARSIGQAILNLAETAAQRETLKDLVELYPGNLTLRELRADVNPVRDRWGRLTGMAQSHVLAIVYVRHVEDVLGRMKKEFGTRYQDATATLERDLAFLKKEYQKRYAGEE